MIDLPKNEYKKSNNCPYCKYHANAAMNPDNEKEKPDEVLIRYFIITSLLKHLRPELTSRIF